MLAWALALAGLGDGLRAAPALGTQAPRFVPTSDGGFAFDTGILRGRLRIGGKSLGLQDVVHLPTGTRLDRSNGLLSHYRVFANGRRWGSGAWDWPSLARLRDDGAVEVTWSATPERRFGLQATYRWQDPVTVDLETTVTAEMALSGFESFVASYFHESFTRAAVATGPSGWLRLDRSAGDWQIFPRDEAAMTLIRDGRWRLEPHPVEWQLRPRLTTPLARRWIPATGLSAVLMAPSAECFAVSSPHETEAHYSTYLSLFGRDLKPGESARARTRLWIGIAESDASIAARHEAYIVGLRDPVGRVR